MQVSSIPQMGLGTFGRTGEEGVRAILLALELGYRHFDTAQTYDTEAVVGRAVAESGLPRSEVFITTKVSDANLATKDFMPSLRLSLENLRVEQVDLTLIHWPSPRDQVPLAEYMTSLAEAKASGLTRLIGVSNFPIAYLERSVALLGHGEIVNNQVELHPFLQQRKLREYCNREGVSMTAYMPLAKGKVVHEPVIQRIAQRHGATEAQVTLAWLLKLGIIVIPASGRRENMEGNLRAADLSLSDLEMAEIAELDCGGRMIDPIKAPLWD
jgi:2,5-diketo-D-gluconate reductase B